MNKFVAALTLLALTGCASTRDWVETHPKTTIFIASVVVLSIPLMVRGHNDSSSNAIPDFPMSIPLTPDCAKLVELCK